MAKRHAHHGGAWKVAYADFVTAMMALFLVLWLVTQDVKIKEAVERAFTHPFATLTKESTGLIPSQNVQAVKSHEGNFDSASAMELNMLRKMSEDIMKTLQSNPDNPESDPMKMEMTPDGMKISVFDRARRPVFNRDSAEFTDYGKWVFSTLAWEVARYTNSFAVELEGHTELGFQPKSEKLTKWELTADRANSARRMIIEHGVIESQIRKVAGFGDCQPLPDRPPEDEGNRRVTVMLKIRGGNRLQ